MTKDNIIRMAQEAGAMTGTGSRMTDQEMLKEAARILREAQRAIEKIAEVDWLVDELENINSLIKAIKARGEK